MKNMTSTFKPNPLPMPRDFVITQSKGKKNQLAHEGKTSIASRFSTHREET